MPLTVRNLGFGYKGREDLIDGLDLAVGEGMSVAVSAPSGAGKTTLLNLLGGLLQPQRGTVSLDDGPISQGRVAWVFQHTQLLARRTVIDNVTLALCSQGIQRHDAEREARAHLAAFGVGDLAEQRTRDISGGEAQRVGLARAAAMRPNVVLADEPTAHLDRRNAQAIAEVLTSGFPTAAVIIATHDPHVAERAGIVAELEMGRLIERRNASP